MSDSKDTCGSCRFFSNGIVGICRRGPPRVLILDGLEITRSPKAYPSGWCGEHKPITHDDDDPCCRCAACAPILARLEAKEEANYRAKETARIAKLSRWERWTLTLATPR